MMRVLDLCSGIGGFTVAHQMVGGFQTVAFCEQDEFCQRVLRKHWPGVPIFDDIRELTWETEAKNNSTQVLQTSQKRDSKATQPASALSADPVQESFSFPQVPPSREENAVHGNVAKNTCEEVTGRIREKANGCAENQTPIGSTEKDTIVVTGTTWSGLINGGAEFLQETITPAKSADSNQKRKGSSTHTTLRNGLNIQDLDSKSTTASRSASHVTKKYMPEIDVLTAGFPCQPASLAGQRRGAEDDRWLWPEIIRIIREAKPRWVLLENVYGLLTLDGGLVFDGVLSDLESHGYAAQAFVVPACAVNAPHRRDRVWVVGHAASQGSHAGAQADVHSGEEGAGPRDAQPKRRSGTVGHADGARQPQPQGHKPEQRRWSGDSSSTSVMGNTDKSCESEERQQRGGQFGGLGSDPWADSAWLECAYRKARRVPQSGFCRVDDGPYAGIHGPGLLTVGKLPHRIDRLRALGNAIVPQVAARFFYAMRAA